MIIFFFIDLIPIPKNQPRGSQIAIVNVIDPLYNNSCQFNPVNFN